MRRLSLRYGGIMTDLYLENGYVNMARIIETDVPFIFVVGGRGTGKTYGALQYMLQQDKIFMLMRRTQTQIDMIKDEDFSPFKVFEDRNIIVKNINKNITGIYEGIYDDATMLNSVSGAPIGYLCALSTISNIRGFSAENIEYIVYDEFIGEKHERALKDEANAFLNAYETINRNRELKGLKPVKMIALANSNNLVNPIFMQLKLVTIVERMKEKGNEVYINKEKGFAIFMLNETEITRAKEQTALYKLSGDSEFSRMSLKNDFSSEEKALIGSRNLKDFKPVCFVGEIAIYQKDRQYYVTDFRKGSAKSYEATTMDLKRFKRDQYRLWLAYLNNRMLFESYFMQTLFERYFGIW